MSSTMLNVNAVKVEINSENLEACRICLAWDGKLYNIREWGLDTMFVELIGTTLSVWDGFPQYVCVLCRALLVKAHALRARSRRADQLLKQALMHQHFITNSFIRSVDRAAHNLTYSLSSEGGKVDVRSYHHDDINPPYSQTPTPLQSPLDTNPPYSLPPTPLQLPLDTNPPYSLPPTPLQLPLDTNPPNSLPPKPPHPLDFVALIENNIRTDDSHENDLNFNLKCDVFYDLHDSSLDTDKQDLQVIDLKDETNMTVTEAKTKEKTIKTVKWKRKKLKKKEDEKIKKKERKHFKFTTEEDIKEFEKKYNFHVQILSEDEMVMEMEKRKMSNKYLKGTYKCVLCYNGFLTSTIYDNHMRSHNPARGEHECELCHVRYKYPVKLREHVQNAHRLKFHCEKCNEVLRGQACAVLHAAYHAGTTFKCTHCDKQFLKKTSRTSHMRASHPVENAAGGTCEMCGETFTSRTGLKSHKTRTHKKVSTPALRCRKCGVQFDNIEAMKRHKESRPDKKCDASLSACESCGETCASADELILHRHRQHNVEIFTCDTCTKSFTSKASLATHMDRVHRRVRPRRPYQREYRSSKRDWLHWAAVCEQCGKRLSCQATLKIHMNRHTGERPYKCAQCPKAYMTPNGLNSHQAFHTGVRKWRCPDCPATFMHQSSVYVHRKIHTGERSHQCTICDKYFTQSGSLYTHMKYVHRKETPPPRKRNKKTPTS